MSGFGHVRPLHDNVWACEAIFEVGEGYRLATPTILSRSSHMRLFAFFQNLKYSYLIFSAISQSVYLNQRTIITMTHYRNEFRDWNYVFQTAKNTLKRGTCNVQFTFWVECFWDIVQCTIHIDPGTRDGGQDTPLSSEIIFKKVLMSYKISEVF